jgi:hypothetical protein
LSGKRNRRRNAIALGVSAALHILFLSFVINETVSPYALPRFEATPPQLEIFPEQKEPPIRPPIIPPKLKRELEKQNQPPPPPLPPTPTPPKPSPQAATPTAPAKPTPPQPSPPVPAPPAQPTPMPARPTPPKPVAIPNAPAPARTPAPPKPAAAPSAKPAPSPGPTATVVAPSAVTARQPAPAVVMRPSRLNIHKSAREAPANVPSLPMAPAGGGTPTAGGGTPGGGPASGPLSGSRLNGLNAYPYGALPSGGPGLRGTLVGCANAEAVRLSGVERSHCNERFGVEAAQAPSIGGIDPAKRSRFDKTADKQERDRAATMPVGTSAGQSGFGGLGGGPQ